MALCVSVFPQTGQVGGKVNKGLPSSASLQIILIPQADDSQTSMCWLCGTCDRVGDYKVAWEHFSKQFAPLLVLSPTKNYQRNSQSLKCVKKLKSSIPVS